MCHNILAYVKLIPVTMSLDEFALLNILETLEEAEDMTMTTRSFSIRKDAFELPDRKFIKIFRLSKSMVDGIVDRINPYMKHSLTSWGLDTSDKVCNIKVRS